MNVLSNARARSMSDLAASGSVALGVRVGEGIGEGVCEDGAVGVGDGPACAETTKAQRAQPAQIATTFESGPRMAPTSTD
jgi:hypothetical protein